MHPIDSVAVRAAIGRKHEDEAKNLFQTGQLEALKGCMTLIAVTCMSKLLSALPHFNFANNVMTSLVRRLESPVDQVCALA